MAFAQKKLVLLTMLLSLFGIATAQTTYYSLGNGSWNDPNTWSNVSHTGSAASTVPGNATDIVIIAAGHVIDFNANHPVNSISIGSLTVGTINGAGILRFPFSDYDGTGEVDDLNANFSLTVAGDVTVNSNGQIINEEGGAGTPALPGNALDRTHALIIQRNLTNTGTLDLEGTTSSRIVDLQFAGTGNQTISGEGTYDTYSITYNNTGTAPNDQIINQSLNFTSSVAAGLSTFIQGTYVHDNTGTYTNQSSVNAGTDYTDVSFDIKNGVFTMAATVSADQTVTISNGNLSVSGGRFNSGSGGTGSGKAVHMVVGGDLTMSGSGELNIGDGDISGPVLPTHGTLTVQGSSSSVDNSTVYTYDLSLASGASLTVSNGATLSAGTAGIGGTFNYDNAAGSCNFYEGLDITSAGSLTMSSGMVVNVIPSLTTVDNTRMTIDGILTMDGGTVNLGANVTTVTAGNLLEIGDGGALNINAGSFNVLTNAGLSSLANTNVVYIENNDAGEDATPGDGAITVGDGAGSSNTSLLSVAPYLAIQAPAQSRDLISLGGANSVLTVKTDGYLQVGGGNTGNLALFTSGARVNVNGGTGNITASLVLNSGTEATVNSGTLHISTNGNTNSCIIFEDDPSAASRFIQNGGTVNIGDGSSLLVIGDGDALPAFGGTGYQSLEITGGTFNLNGGFQLNDANARFIMSSGTLNINPQSSQSLAGTLDIFYLDRGIVNFSGGQMNIVNPHAAAGSGYALHINPYGDPGTTGDRISGISALPTASAINFAGTVRFGNGTSSLSGSTEGFDVNMDAGHTYGSFIVNNPTGTNRQVELTNASSNYLLSGNLFISAGTLDMNTNQINRKTSGGVFILGSAGYLIIGNNDNANHFPGNNIAFSTSSIALNSTVAYDGAGDALVRVSGPVSQFGNLIIAGTGTKTLNSSATVSNVLTLEGSTFATSTRLTMGSGSTIVRTGTDADGIMTGTVQGGNNYTVGYSGNAKTTQASEWSGTGSKSWVINMNSGQTLTAHDHLTVGGNLNLNSGTLDDAGFMLTVNGNLYNAGLHTGSGKILLTGGAAAHTISGDGSGQFQNLELDDANGALFASAQSVNGTLTLTSGVLDISTYLLALAAPANVDDTAPDNTKMIQVEGSPGAAGVQKTFSGVGSFTWPVGTNGKYTPATINVISTGSGGSITMKPVDAEHPSNLDAANLALDYYWQVSTTGFSTIQATHTYVYDQADQTGRGNEVAYIPARYAGGAWTTLDTIARVDENTNTIAFNNVSYLDGDFTAGEPSEFGPVVTYYSRIASGAWNDPDSWSTVAIGGAPAATIPGSSTPIVVGGGNTILATANNSIAPSIDIQANGILEIADNTSGHNLGTVSGQGTLRIITDDATATAFPGGTYTNFLGATGGTVEYTGMGIYTMTNTPLGFHHLVFRGTGTVTLPGSNMSVGGDVTLLESVVVQPNSSSAGDVSITGDLNVSSANATFQFQAGTARIVRVDGDITNDGTIQLSGEGVVSHTIAIKGNLVNNNLFDLASSLSSHRCDLSFTGSSTQNLTGDVEFGGLYIDGAGLTINGNMNIAGDFTLVNGPFSPGNYTVDFNGSTAQQVTGTPDFYNLTKSGGGSLTLNNNATITNTLTLTNGIINTSDAALLTMEADAVVSGGSDNSYIQGPLAHVVTIDGLPVTKIFPLGSGNKYRGVSLSLNPTNIVTNGTATYTGVLNAGAPPSRTLPGGIDHVSGIRYYTISQNTGGLSYDPNATVTVLYNDDDGVDTPADLRLAKSNGSGGWMDIGGTGSGTSSGQITSDVFHSFSDFALASSSVNNPLPVRLLQFHAEVKDEEGVQLFWQTGSEENNAYFVVERSAEGKVFFEIARVNGAGTSGDILDYAIMDHHPLQGRNYYRLKQVDFDEAFSYSQTVVVQYKQHMAPDWIIVPNPAMHGEAEVVIQGMDKNERMEIWLYNTQGRKLQTYKTQADASGKAVVKLTNLSVLPKGIYSVLVAGSKGSQTRKIILE